MYDFGEDTRLFKALDPSLLWSRETIRKGEAKFFQRAIGMSDADGINLYEQDTNMTQCGQLGTPLSYRRREILLFPAYVDRFDISKWTEMIEHSKIGDLHFGPSRIKEYEDMEFFPDGRELPTPETYNRVDYVDLVKQASHILGFVGRNKPPCKLIRSVRTFGSVEPLGLGIISDPRYDGITTYAVFVGAMWVPKSHEEVLAQK